MIGRGEDCDLTLPDVKVSRRHVELTDGPEPGTLALRDLGSGNGTFVNGQRIESATLRGREQVQLGDIVLHVQSGDEPEPGDGTIIGSTANLPQTQSALHRLVVQRGLRRATVLGALAVLLAAGGVAFLLLRNDNSGRDQVAAAVTRVGPSTVYVESTHGGTVVESGSGWVLDARAGLIVTNAHVINGGDAFSIATHDGVRVAKVVGAAPCEDLAVLRVADRHGLRSLALGRQSSLRQGQTVVAVGFPGNASREADLTSTVGVVSVARSAFREPAIDVPSYPNVIQTDAAINPGNSGGPLVGLDGRLVGVNSADRTLSPDGRIIQGQAYAIGVDRVRAVVQRLRHGISTGWLGAGFEYPAAKQLRGAGAAALRLRIAPPVPGSPAARANLGGAQIAEVNDVPVGASLQGWCDAIGGVKPAALIKLRVIPRGQRAARTVRVRLA